MQTLRLAPREFPLNNGSHFASRWCPVPEIRGILLRSKWAAGKAVRAGLALEGAYLNRYVTDEQCGRRPIFIATLWAGASWLFFRVARSTRMTRIWALRSCLEKQPTDLRQNTSYFGDRTLGEQRLTKEYVTVPSPESSGSIRGLLRLSPERRSKIIRSAGDPPATGRAMARGFQSC
jgi:hypothetical protein